MLGVHVVFGRVIFSTNGFLMVFPEFKDSDALLPPRRSRLFAER